MRQRNAQPALHFVWLEVADVARSRAFYEDILQLPIAESREEFVAVSLGETSLYLAPGQPRPASIYLAIAVSDIDALYQHLVDAGKAVSSPQDEGWARYIELTDPDGYRLYLLTPAQDEA